MPFAKEIKDNVVVMETTFSDSYIPDIMRDAVETLGMIVDGVEKRSDGSYVGHPMVIRAMRAASPEERKNFTATISVNGCTVPYTTEISGMQLYSMYKAECDRKSEEFRKSPEGIKQAEERAKNVAENQIRLDTELNEIGMIALAACAQRDHGHKQPVGELAAKLFGSLARLVDAGDLKGVNYDRSRIQNLLCSMGYVRSEYVGRNEEIVNLETWRAYVAGQIIDCLRPDSFGLLPPHAAITIRERGLDTDTLIPRK